MGTWCQYKGEFHARPRAFSKASAQMVRMQCVLYPPARVVGRVLDKAGILGRDSSTAGIFGRILDTRGIFGRHFAVLGTLSVRNPPDNDSNVQISPDNARRVRIPPGVAKPSQGTKRARKKFPSPYSVNGRKRRSARVAMRRARGILTHKSLDELSPNHIEHL